MISQSSLLLLLLAATSTHGFLPVGAPSRATRSLLVNMFTGIVEEMGTVVSLEERNDMILWDGSKGSGTELVVKADVVLGEAYLG